MDIRRVLSVVGVFTLATSVALSGDPYRGHYGGTCDKGEAENQEASLGDGGKDNSDPIYLATGDFQHVQTDLVIPGRGMDFEIKRFFRSKSGFYARATTYGAYEWRSGNGDDEGAITNPLDHPPVGMNWDFNYNMRVHISGSKDISNRSPQPTGIYEMSAEILRNGSLTVFLGNGRFERFETDCSVSGDPVTPELCTYTNDLYDKVIEFTHPAMPVVLRDSDNTEYTFLPSYDYNPTTGVHTQFMYAGRLASITDRNGNTISFTYETSFSGDERIAYAIDTLGHQINFYYHDDASSPINNPEMGALIWKIVDHAGRIVEYDYTDVNGNAFKAKMSRATLPSITATPDFPLLYIDGGTVIDHGRFPNGRIWEYEYTGSLGGSFSDGLLSKITDPNGVVILENEFNDGTNYEARTKGRVTRQVYAGDAYNYIATTTEGSTDFWTGYYAQWAQDYYVWVNDRKGAITRFKYSGNDDSPTDMPGQPDQPRHLQLLEKVEYLGFVDNPDQQVWATCDASGNPTAWYTYDTNNNVIPLTGTLPGMGIVRTWTPNRRWGNEVAYAPRFVGATSSDYTTTVFDDDSDNPLRWKTILSQTRWSADGQESINEQWHYGFDFAGCGCGGSRGYATGYKDGNGNVTFRVFDTAINPITGRPTGNLRKVYHGLPPGSSINPSESYAQANAAAVDEYTYNQWGQVLTHTHPKKIILDAQGNEIEHQRVDQFEYYSDQEGPANRGRLQRMRIDVNGFDLSTTYDYDLIGNMIKETGPDGDVTEYLYNQASQLVRVEHFNNAQKLFAEKMYFYDANGNLVVEEEKNLDGDQNLVSSNKWFTTVFVYDQIGARTEMSSEKNAITGIFSGYTGVGLQASSQTANPNYASQRWAYDANRNMTKFEDGEAVNGNQLSNTTVFEHGARDLLVKKVEGSGGVSSLTTAYVYDAKGRVEKQTINPGEPELQETAYTYDAFDRAVGIVDSMGNEYFYSFDDNDNVLSAVACGPILEDDDNGSQPQVTLAKFSRVHDTLNRLTSESFEIFGYDYTTGNGEICENVPASSTQQVTNIVYNNDSSVHEIDAPSGDNLVREITESFYDTACRLDTYMDGAGNTTTYTYDNDSNVEKIVQIDSSTEPPFAFEQYEVSYVYDPLQRQVKMFDGVGNQTFFEFDSRSNMVKTIDPRGNISQFVYDPLGRQISSTAIMTDTGDGNGVQAGTITESRMYDDSRRVISETDDNGNQTSYEYDGLGRMLKVTMPDGAFYSSTYDANGNPATYTDARGVVITMGFDRKNRLTSRTIDDSTVPGGIPGAASEIFTYDGLGRLRTARSPLVRITREYDSLSNVTREIQNTDAGSGFAASFDRVVEYEFDTANNNTKLVYPSGREIYRTYDELNRLAGIFNQYDAGTDTYSSPVTEFEYVGVRVGARIHGNGTRTDYGYNGYQGASNDPNDFGFGRVASIRTTIVASGSIIDGFDFTWDRNQNRISYKDVGSGMKNRRERAFSYDSANRLVSTDVDFPDPLTDFAFPTNNGITAYTLDSVHNRTAVSGFEGSGTLIGAYSQSGNHAANNQYSLTPREAGGEWSYVYDENGNMILKAQNSAVDYNGDYTVNFFDVSVFNTAYANGDMSADYNGDGVLNFFDVSAFLEDFNPANGTDLEHWSYTYDFRNQLVGISQGLGASVLSTTTNTYDPLARRVLESVAGVTKQMVYGGVSHWEVLEQIDLSGATEQVLTTHVYGLGIDDEVSYRLEDLAIPEDIWSHRDDLNSLTSISDENGNIVERYEYGDYGEVSIFDAAGVAISVTAYSAQHLYTGRSLITGTGLYDYRNRAMDSSTGRFVQQDPLGYIDAMNLYTYVASSPMVFVDPMGEVIPLVVGGVVITITAFEAAAAAAGLSVAACMASPSCRDAAAQLIQDAANNAANNVRSIGTAIRNHYVKKELAKQAARKLAARVAACEATYAAYANMKCPKCLPTDSEETLLVKIACVTGLINLRSRYISLGCDFVPGFTTNKRLEDQLDAQDGHVDQLNNKLNQLKNCAGLLANCAG